MSLDLDEEPFLAQRREPADEVAWVLLFVDGLVLGSSSLFWILRGRFFDRGFYEAITGGGWTLFSAIVSPGLENATTAATRLAGFLGAMSSILIIAIAMTSFRRGERWAWYAMWTLPAFAVLDFGLIAGYSALTVTSVTWDITLFGLAMASLVLSYRRFFPRTEAPRQAHAT